MKKLFFAFLALLLFVGISIAASPEDLTDIERLGRHLYKDKNLSYYQNQSCQVCHHPFSGFADRRNSLSPETSVVSIGSDGVSTGGRNAPTSAYAGYSPVLALVDGEYVGGMFWDGRATGETLGDPLAEQAEGPPLNEKEMAMPDKESVIDAIAASDYANLFKKVFGKDAFSDTDTAYDNFARAVAAYERSTEVTAFSSKYDLAYGELTDKEIRGEELFETKCSGCHSSEPTFEAPGALFTNYQYANIGVPSNPLVPLDAPDPGLGATADEVSQNGKFKVPTLRNVAASPPYTHNGSFSKLTEIVAFINDSSGYEPEIGDNLDTRVGNMGLTSDDVDDLVAFLMTLTDGY